jgi:transcription elongation factor Elf1
MQNKAARKLAKSINLSMGLTQPADEAEKKYGKTLLPQKRDFHRILYYLENKIREDDPTIPRTMSASHFAVVKKALQIALRDTNTIASGKCPTCKKIVEPVCTCPDCNTAMVIAIPYDKLEKNSINCLEIVMDRMAPKLASLTTEVNVYNTIVNIGSGLAQIITQYVSPDKRLDCNIQIRSLLESYKNASSQAINS